MLSLICYLVACCFAAFAVYLIVTAVVNNYWSFWEEE